LRVLRAGSVWLTTGKQPFEDNHFQRNYMGGGASAGARRKEEPQRKSKKYQKKSIRILLGGEICRGCLRPFVRKKLPKGGQKKRRWKEIKKKEKNSEKRGTTEMTGRGYIYYR